MADGRRGYSIDFFSYKNGEYSLANSEYAKFVCLYSLSHTAPNIGIKLYPNRFIIGLEGLQNYQPVFWTKYFSYIPDINNRIIYKKNLTHHRDWKVIDDLLKFHMGTPYESAIEFKEPNEILSAINSINKYILINEDEIEQEYNNFRSLLLTSYLNFVLIHFFHQVRAENKLTLLKHAIDNQSVIMQKHKDKPYINSSIELAWQHLIDACRYENNYKEIVQYYLHAKKNQMLNHLTLAQYVTSQLKNIKPEQLDLHIEVAVKFYQQAMSSQLLAQSTTSHLMQASKNTTSDDPILTIIKTLISDGNFKPEKKAKDSLDLLRLQFMLIPCDPQQTLDIFNLIDNKDSLAPIHWQTVGHAYLSQFPLSTREQIINLDKDTELTITANAFYFFANICIHHQYTYKDIPEERVAAKRICEKLIESYKNLSASKENTKSITVEMNKRSSQPLDDNQLNTFFLALETQEEQIVRIKIIELLTQTIKQQEVSKKFVSNSLFSSQTNNTIQELQNLKREFESSANDLVTIFKTLQNSPLLNDILETSSQNTNSQAINAFYQKFMATNPNTTPKNQ